MPLTKSPGRATPPAQTRQASPPPKLPRETPSRRPRGELGELVTEVVDELTAWNPREFIVAFQRWHQGQISLIQLNVLAMLEATGPLPMSRLAEALDISVASLTGVIDRMEARDLAVRRRDVDDRRVILVEPGEGGRRVFAEIDKRRREGLGRLLSSLGETELRGLLAGHRALRAARAEMAGRCAPKVDGTVTRARAARTEKIDALLARARSTGAGKPARAAGEPAS